MPNLAGQPLSYIQGIKSGASAALWSAIKGAGRVTGRPFAHRTGIGAAAGGAYGAMSDDTSVLGGAAMGAGAARYGGMGARMGMRNWKFNRGGGVPRQGMLGSAIDAMYSGFGGMKGQAMSDVGRMGRSVFRAHGKSTSLLANRGFTKIASTLNRGRYAPGF